MKFVVSNEKFFYEDGLNFPIINGNILDVEAGTIVHSVNCMGVMESGVAKQIKDKYPEHYKQYLLNCLEYKDKKNLLGTFFSSFHYRSDFINKVGLLKPGFFICGIFGQYEYNKFGMSYKQQTDYEKFFNALYSMYEYTSEYSDPKISYKFVDSESTHITVEYDAKMSSILYMPYRIGCGLGGGDWNEMKKRFNEFQIKCPLMPIVFVKK